MSIDNILRAKSDDEILNAMLKHENPNESEWLGKLTEWGKDYLFYRYLELRSKSK